MEYGLLNPVVGRSYFYRDCVTLFGDDGVWPINPGGWTVRSLSRLPKIASQFSRIVGYLGVRETDFGNHDVP